MLYPPMNTSALGRNDSHARVSRKVAVSEATRRPRSVSFVIEWMKTVFIPPVVSPHVTGVTPGTTGAQFAIKLDMALREFTDAAGKTWTVWSTRPDWRAG